MAATVDRSEQRRSPAQAPAAGRLAARHDLVHRELHVERRGDHQQLEDHREDEDLHQRRARCPCSFAPEGREGSRAVSSFGVKPSAGDELQRDAGQVLRRLGQREVCSPAAGSWITIPARGDGLSTTKWFMSQCRIAGRPAAARCVELEAQRSARQVQLVRHLDQPAQRHALQRDRMPAAQRVQVDAVAVVAGDHRQAGEPALGRLGLQDVRQAASRRRNPAVLRSSLGPRAQQGVRGSSSSRCAARG